MRLTSGTPASRSTWWVTQWANGLAVARAPVAGAVVSESRLGVWGLSDEVSAAAAKLIVCTVTEGLGVPSVWW